MKISLKAFRKLTALTLLEKNLTHLITLNRKKLSLFCYCGMTSVELLNFMKVLTSHHHPRII
ncbi:CLUMA_CG017762, isoform A [Clunio marinus]|uniref:CLUMA_CG017762, isoform A n=1 Tax=Clunio marinus TaxID=568069 RepID=A0A1J1IYB8_9DIPT|nr:CLUMA_CG017762, isoform A [Clunio marinus]